MDYTASGKLLGLFEVLQQTEIITANNDPDEIKGTIAAPETSLADYATTSPDVPTQSSIVCHRALIFCQMSSCLDLVCSQILDRFGVKYQKLLGSYGARERHQIVNQFNHDSSVRVLILTTQVGGLGLTLTGADIVIFMEHDWNPMNDLQAMDRAHRIGQTKTVNVYRLIMRDTIEDKIMSLQRFKENLAKSLIQARGGDITTNDVANLELTDLLKSFEEHSGYKKAEGHSAKPVDKEQKPIKGAHMMKQLMTGGIPTAEGMEIAGQAGDTELANIEKIWQAVSDVEEM